MKKRVFVLLNLLLIVKSVYSEDLILKKIVKCEESKSFRFLDNDLLFYKSTVSGLYFYDSKKNKICYFYYPEKKRYQLIQFNSYKRLILGLSDDKPNYSDLSRLNFYYINLKYNLSEKIDDLSKCMSEIRFKNISNINSKIINYDPSYVSAEICDYYLVASDALNHGIEVNEEAPEKHSYHDMDLCLIDNQGTTCAVLPFTVDEQTAMDKSILESSPDGNLVKIKASSSYFYAKINDNLLDKYPELQNGLFYFIYEISNDQTPHKVEYIDMSSEFNLEEGKEIDVKYENKDYSCFDIKILENHIKKESAIQKNQNGGKNDKIYIWGRYGGRVRKHETDCTRTKIYTSHRPR